MSYLLQLFLVLSLSFSSTSEESNITRSQDAITTYYLIRHAEKDRSDSSDHDPSLTPAGLQRAENWAKILKGIKLDAIYSTAYARTMQTAGPTAKLKQLEILSYAADDLYNHEFARATKGKTVLVTGHSNTTPELANAIIGQKRYEHIDDAENGALFIIQVLADGSTLSQVLYIN